MWRAHLSGALLGAALLGTVSCAAKTAGCPYEMDRVAVRSATGEHCFTVEIADDPEERSKGLMHVRHMEKDHGMLFLFDWVDRQSFWMKNTFISLDIIFIAPDGQIAKIAARTEPLSEESIPSGAPVVAILEINGGLAEELGIKLGDTVHHPRLPGGRSEEEKQP